MKYEEKILKYLVENYRKSKKDSGENKTNRRTQVKPEKIYKKYSANDGDYEEITKLNQAVQYLKEKGFVTYEMENFGTQILVIYLVDERIHDAEAFLKERCGYVSKDSQIEALKVLIGKYENASPICQKECLKLEEYVQNRKVPNNIDELNDVLKAIAFIEKNQEKLYIREVSMKVYGDSKFFEETTLKTVCNILRKYSGTELQEGEMIDEILLNYHVAKEPQKLSMKGNAIICIKGKTVDISGFSEGIELHATDLENIQWIKINASKFMTIENRTSYLRYGEEDTVVFYLGGYANRHQRDFIKKAYESNKNISYLHFGDIDAGGFWIHNNLCEVTGVNFNLFCMSRSELMNPEFATCLHKLSSNDRSKLQELKKFVEYQDTIQYMLDNNVKLEQEIVSLNLMKDI